MAKKIEKALVFKLPKIIKPYVTNNQTMCSFILAFCGVLRSLFSRVFFALFLTFCNALKISLGLSSDFHRQILLTLQLKISLKISTTGRFFPKNPPDCPVI